MTGLMRLATAFALINGMLAVVASALASHVLGGSGEAARTAFDVAARMHLIHSLLMLVIARWWASESKFSLAASCGFLALGIVLFSISIYAKVMIGDSILSRFTPLGGLFLMAGWLSPVVAVFDSWRQSSKADSRSLPSA